MTGSNRRPPACKAGALPAELIPLLSTSLRLLITSLLGHLHSAAMLHFLTPRTDCLIKLSNPALVRLNITPPDLMLNLTTFHPMPNKTRD